MSQDAYSGVDNLEAMEEAKNYNRFLLDLFCSHTRPGTKTLDFGAGLGTFAEMARSRALDVHCLEPDDSLRERLHSRGFPSYASLEETHETFGFIYSLNVLEHIEDDIGALVALRRHLAPDGRIFIYVPAFPALFSSMDRKVGHFRRYTMPMMRERLDKAGLSPCAMRYADSLGFWASLLYKRFGSPQGDVKPGEVRTYDRFVFPVSRRLDRLTGSVFGKNLWVLAEHRKATR